MLLRLGDRVLGRRCTATSLTGPVDGLAKTPSSGYRPRFFRDTSAYLGSCEVRMDATILVVDDDPTIRTLITRVLTRVGYQVQEAEDGLSALAQIALTRPALVLTDLMMPRMNGDALIVQVRQPPDPIPCILMTAFHRDSPPDDVPLLAKPFAIPDLVRLVDSVLSRPSASTETI